MLHQSSRLRPPLPPCPSPSRPSLSAHASENEPRARTRDAQLAHAGERVGLLGSVVLLGQGVRTAGREGGEGQGVFGVWEEVGGREVCEGVGRRDVGEVDLREDGARLTVD